jgi:predicted nucleic acid-binding protein
MPPQKIRAFLDTNVLLQYIRGKAELRGLFSEEVRERAVFAINDIVLQEFLLARDKTTRGIDFTSIVPYLEVLDVSPDTNTALRDLRNRAVHANDLLILESARSCDVLLTYDRDLLNVGQQAAVRSETPEEFLVELGAAA